MSIKLHEGVRIKEPDLVGLLPRLNQLRKEMLQVSDELAVRYVLASACAHHDRLVLGLPWPDSEERAEESGVTGSFLVQAQMRLMEKHLRIEQGKERRAMLDFSASVCLLPVRGELLAVPYIVNPALRVLWKAQTWHEPFGFWDNTDPDPSLSPQEWAHREGLWTEALASSDWVVGAASYIYEFSQTHGGGLAMPTMEHAHLIPDVGQRAKALAPYGYLVEERQARERREPIARTGRIADEPRTLELQALYEKLLNPLDLQGLMQAPGG